MTKLFAILFTLIPLGTGLSVLGLIWSEPFGGFGSIPSLIRLLTSCVASAFVLVGLAGIYEAIRGSNYFELAAGKIKTLERRLRERRKTSPVSPLLRR